MHAERWAGLVGLRPIILDKYDLPTLLSTVNASGEYILMIFKLPLISGTWNYVKAGYFSEFAVRAPMRCPCL